MSVGVIKPRSRRGLPPRVITNVRCLIDRIVDGNNRAESVDVGVGTTSPATISSVERGVAIWGSTRKPFLVFGKILADQDGVRSPIRDHGQIDICAFTEWIAKVIAAMEDAPRLVCGRRKRS